MSSWMNEAAVQNHNGAGFNHLDSNPGGAMLDPSSFMNNSPSFDPSQFQNQQLQARMQNGAMRNGSPAFNNPQYQTNPVIPSKRPRPMEDSLGQQSPRQAPNMPPTSRSQTPQQGQQQFPGFPTSSTPQPQPQQNMYAHLQNGSTNASPSPVMGNQLRPGGVPQRVSTASPHSFSPAGQNFPQQSPSSEHGSRVDTPQNSNAFNPNPGFAQGFNPNFTPPPGRTSAPPQNPMSTPNMPQPNMPQSQMMMQQAQQQQRTPQDMNQQKILYQMRLQQQLQQQGMMGGQRPNMPTNVNPMARQMPGQNPQLPGNLRPQQPGQPRGVPNPEQFMKSLMSFMQQKQLPLDVNPTVNDRTVPIMQLYVVVMKFGGYKKVTMQNGWNQVALALQFPPIHSPNAAAQLKTHYERNLLMFEEAWQVSQQRQRAAMMQQNPNAGTPGPQMSPTKSMNTQASLQQTHIMQQQALLNQQHQLQQQHGQSTPVKQMAMQQPPVNGFSTPQQPGQPHPMGPQGHARNSLSRTMDVTAAQNGSSFTMPSPVSASKPGNLSLQPPHAEGALHTEKPPTSSKIELPAEFHPKTRELDTFGGIEVESLSKLGGDLLRWRPDVPIVQELGTIDIDALTRSLQSGIHAEVRLALDTLVTLAIESRLQLDLRACEDLVETLVDCAETQVELLAENADEVTDVIDVNSYEDVFRSCRSDADCPQEIQAFGSPEYELDRAVDRLICITTIMRNLSFYDMNHGLLADEQVIKFLCVVIRYLGTRNMLLRSNINTLDFMKDIIIFLSNLAHAIEIPGREQALCLLHFVHAFAPCPLPNSLDAEGNNRVVFSPYDPAMHRYLPSAVDSLAKILARDEPNRTFFKTIFASDVLSSPPYDLLTKTFALAISAIPDVKQDLKRGNQMVSLVEARKPILMQGMLAAEILSNIAPGHESGIPQAWLSSEDGFAQNLSRLVLSLCLESVPPAPPQRGQAPPPRGVEDEGLYNIAQAGVNVLRRLAEKSRNSDEPSSTMPMTGVPSKDQLLEALLVLHPRLQGVLKQLCAYYGLGT